MTDTARLRQRVEEWAYEPHDSQFAYRTARLLKDLLAAVPEDTNEDDPGYSGFGTRRQMQQEILALRAELGGSPTGSVEKQLHYRYKLVVEGNDYGRMDSLADLAGVIPDCEAEWTVRSDDELASPSPVASDTERGLHFSVENSEGPAFVLDAELVSERADAATSRVAPSETERQRPYRDKNTNTMLVEIASFLPVAHPTRDQLTELLHRLADTETVNERCPLREALEDVAEFLETVTEWTGSSGEELAEIQDVIDAALAPSETEQGGPK